MLIGGPQLIITDPATGLPMRRPDQLPVQLPNMPTQADTPEPVYGGKGFDLLNKLATQAGPSEATKYSMQQNLLNRQNTIDAGTRANAGAQASALSGLEARGGAGSGARERLATSGANATLMGTQGAYRAQGSADAAALGAGENQKIDLLKNVSDLEMQKYQQDVAKWGAGKQADALARSAQNSGGGK